MGKNKFLFLKILFFLMSSLISYGKNIKLDDMLKTLEEKSYEREIFDLEQKKNLSKEKYYNLDNYNGVRGEISTDYDYEEDKIKSNGRVSYGEFYLDLSKDKINSQKNSDTDVIIGVNKSLKNMFYSKSDSEIKKLEYSKKNTEYSYYDDLETKKISLINLYEEYKNNEFEIKLKTNNLTRLKSEEKILKKSYELGATPKIDLDTLQTSRNNLEIELKYLKENIKKIKNRFLYEFGIDISKDQLMDIEIPKVNISDFISNIGERKISRLGLEKEITKENIKYLKYSNKIPEVLVGVEHQERNNGYSDENRVFLKLSKDIFYYDINLENEKITLDQQEINIQKEKEINISKKLEVEENCNNLYKNYLVNKNKAELEKNKYEIINLKYKLGDVTYVDVMDVFDDYLNYQVAAEKAKNLFNGYIYEILVRGEKNYE
ncbi:TolC family protein [uncultured Fusobacterium sp.]|uniref:TolC family protein n=1 Tax=uncultured Fusobacterium sp. TaxID=159267 RepID=UPI0015A5DB9E|nr:TolC family protein [uncultured Fusobacterium sp.]